jgi:hypothetical protein
MQQHEATYPNCGKPLKPFKIVVKSNSFAYRLFSKEGVVGETLVSLLGYQALDESLKWLRVELRYRKNPSHEDVSNTSEIGNPQPSL